MKNRSYPIALCALLLASCGQSGSASDVSSNPSTASSEVSSTSSSEMVASSVSEESFDRTLPSREGLPYVQNLDVLKKHDFQGRFIWEKKTVADTHVAFRFHVSLEKDPQKAILHLSAESKATVFVNGEVAAIDAVLKRGPTKVDSFYQDVDLASFLKKGGNVVTILVHYWAHSGNASVDPGVAGLIYDLEVDGKTYSSGSSTKVKRLDSYRNIRVLSGTGEYPERDRSTFLSEREIYYDARLEEDFASLSYDDSSWANATEIGLPGYVPFGDLYLGDIPAFTYEEIVDAVDVDGVLGKTITEPTTAHFRLSENMQFLPYFELEAENGGEDIAFYTNTYRTQNNVSLMDDYVCKKGNNVYQHLYWRSGSTLILDLPAGVRLTKVGYRRTAYDAAEIGYFHSELEDMTTLWNKASNTLRICMRDTFMDCPERERSPYAGDSANQIAEALYTMGEDGWKMLKKTYLTLSGWAREDGIFPLRWPSTTTNECPMQNLAFSLTLSEYYRHTGDLDTVKATFPILANYVSLWNLNDDGSVKYRDGTFQWTDWGSGMDNELMENGWYYWACQSLNDLGKMIGDTSHQAFFEERLPRIKAAFAPKFRKEKGFASKEGAYDDRGNALAVLSGLADEEDYEDVANILISTKKASPYMERYAEEALGKMGKYEALKDRILDRYQPMIDYDESTLWEVWSPKPKDGTINHGWSGGPLLAMAKYYAGIVPTSGGYATYDVTPDARLGEFEALAPTPRGNIILSYKGNTLIISGPSGGTLTLNDSFGEVLQVEGSSLVDGSYALSGETVTVTFAN
ncbi:MAG: hypothetical protein J6A47_10685 [Bacilli bacterium]|nr:hypothetical protein [Bacilli bacterium]